MVRSLTEVAIGLLARREHSVFELRRKLLQKGFAEGEVESVLVQLTENNLLSDERFAETYINMRRQRGYGPLRIAQELKERGVSPELAAAFLDHYTDDWQGLLARQYRKKYGNETVNEFKEKAKRMRFLQSRGYPLDMISSFINNQ